MKGNPESDPEPERIIYLRPAAEDDLCVCVLGSGNRRREGKTRERLCAWEPDLFFAFGFIGAKERARANGIMTLCLFFCF